MNTTYIEILVADMTYHGNDALTYATDKPVAIGAIVLVNLRNKQVLGLVVAKVGKPNFKVKPVERIYDITPLSRNLLELLEWMRAYYPAPVGVTTGLFLPPSMPQKVPLPQPIQLGSVKTQELPDLTIDQQNALKAIHGPGLHILHGETGTGKTRVYIELTAKALAQNKSVIILTPEIGLTSQLTNDFRKVFGDNVLLLHSQLTESARRNIWLQIVNQKNACVIIGPRSALFSPLQNVGLIVVDESHETAYKQDRAPYYHASHVAAKLAHIHQATFVLGSATPLITDYAIAQAKQRPIVRMEQTAKAPAKDVDVRIVDLRERKNLTKSSYISNLLIEKIGETLQRNEQVLLFLNRRGTARIIFCEKCSWQANCPHCDLPLVYHGDSHQIQCHSCAYRSASPSSCPECRNTAIIFKSAGTKAIAEEVSRLFQNAKIQRFDTDNTKQERIESNFDAIQRGDIDIIIGTQTIAKGIDLPKLGLVGVIMADASLSFPDFSAQERTYQLLHQVVGRVGRGHRNGTAIIQTYNPQSPTLKLVLKKDWEAFSEQELQERQQYKFPPYYYLLKLTCRRATPESAAKASERLAQKLSEKNLNIIIEGPAPCFREKIQGKYQWQLIVKSHKRHELLKVISALPAQWSYDIDPLNLL